MWKLLLEEPLEVEPDRVAVVPGMDEHVGRQRRETRRELPDVEVVDVDDVRMGGERAADLLGIEVGGGRLEQHASRLAEQADARIDHEPGNHERGDGVRALEPGGDDHDAGDQRADERVEIGEDVAEARLDVEASTARRARAARSPPRFTTMPAAAVAMTASPCTVGGVASRSTASKTSTAARTSSVAPLISAASTSARLRPKVSPPFGGRLREPERHERHAEGCDVGEHVAGVGEQRERARDDRHDHLAGHERRDQAESGNQWSLIRARARSSARAAPRRIGVASQIHPTPAATRRPIAE